MASNDSRITELISFDRADSLQDRNSTVITNSYASENRPLGVGFPSRHATNYNASEEREVGRKIDANFGDGGEDLDDALKIDVSGVGSTSKSGSLLREYLSKQAMRNNVAEELGIPGNSEVALQAVVEFERTINAKCAEGGGEDIEDDVQDDSCHQDNDTRMPKDSLKGGIPEEFVSPRKQSFAYPNVLCSALT